MAKQKASPETVSHRPLFEWFEADKKNRARLREAGYTDGRLTNWKKRGIPRAEVAAIAAPMGLSYEQYLMKAGEPVALREPSAEYRGVSDEALEVARGYDQLSADCQEHVRRQIELLRGADDSSGRRRAVQHDVEINRGKIRPGASSKKKKGVR